MISLIIVLAIVVSIVLGFKTKKNTGIFAIAFAYIIGCYMLGMKTGDFIKTWPVKIFFYLMSVSLFYGFAIVNGTLEKLSKYLLYYSRKSPRWLPYILFGITMIMAGLGVGNMPVIAFFTPIMFMICEKSGIDPLVGAMAINYGSLAGTNFMTSANGVVYRGVMDDAGFSAQSFTYSASIFLGSVIIPIIVLGLLTFVLKGSRITVTELDIEKPEPFTGVQKKTFYLIMIMLFVVLIGPLLHLILPGNAVIATISGNADIGCIASIFAVIASLMDLADEKAVIAKIPWKTIILIGGVGMLISIAQKAGTVDILANWVSGNIPVVLVPIVITIIGACMSFFSSTVGVVCPTLFPIVPVICEATGINPMILFTAIIIGAQASAISPFSAAGSIIIGGCEDEKVYNKLYPELIVKAIPISVVFAVLLSIVMSVIF